MNNLYKGSSLLGLLLFSFTLLGQTEITLFVDGACPMCEDRIEEAVLLSPGVLSADWDLSTRQLTVTVNADIFEEIQLHYLVTDLGHDTNMFSASEEAYQNLPACCQYRNQAEPAGENELHGYVFTEGKKGKQEPLVGATLSWLGATAGAVTDEFGSFHLVRSEGSGQLVVSYIGYENDTLEVQDAPYVEILLNNSPVLLEGVEVNYRRKSTEISFVKTLKVEQISQKELSKAACCNLSESFETNPSVDVSFTDAVTGTRQIQMLGLAGPYVQITRENMPDIRGLSSIFGLTYTPGPWVESIQLAKGPGTVVNGFESMTGQINVELKKPEESERFYLNLYANEGGRLEGNTNFRFAINENISTGFLLHAAVRPLENDRNKDGFLDNPIGTNLIAINRWKFFGDHGWVGQAGIKGSFLDQTSGQTQGIINPWQAIMDTRRLEGWMKVGRVLPRNLNTTFGFQAAASYHDQQARFGTTEYDATQRSMYTNFIYQTILGSTFHTLRTGASFQYDAYQEIISDQSYDRTETVPGAYAEYTYQPNERFTGMLGLRGDYHNLFGFFFTPRLHLRLGLAEESVLRLSLGRGQRTANIFAENIGVFAGNRSLVIQSGNPELPYGLNPEVSWNAGLNFSQGINLAGRELVAGLDLYHTRFTSQVVVDYDQDAQALFFYNLNGTSFSNSLQFQVDYELLPRWDVRVAYRFNDVQTSYLQGQLEKPLVARHRSFINMSYETDNGWQFDGTLNWQGSKRLPDTQNNPELFRLDERSPAFFLLNSQISKSWNGNFDLYLGAENLLNFVQENPILSSQDPLSPYFDSSMVWGPIFGRMVYAGMRYTLE